MNISLIIFIGYLIGGCSMLTAFRIVRGKAAILTHIMIFVMWPVALVIIIGQLLSEIEI